jgi:hypothetical protein
VVAAAAGQRSDREGRGWAPPGPNGSHGGPGTDGVHGSNGLRRSNGVNGDHGVNGEHGVGAGNGRAGTNNVGKPTEQSKRSRKIRIRNGDGD